MSRKGMLSMEEAARAAVTWQVAAAHAGGFANSGKAAVQRGAFGGLRSGYGRVRDYALSARESSKISDRQH